MRTRYYIAQLASPYTLGPAHTDAYLYSPAFLDVLAPFQLLPWPLFEAIWTLIIGLAVIATTRRWALVVIVMGVGDLLFGNVNLLIGAALVASFRYPATWSFIVLTQGHPGIGLLWLATRREWRALSIALGSHVALIALSGPGRRTPWAGWINILGVGAAHPYQCSDTSLQCILFQPPLVVRVLGRGLADRAGALRRTAMGPSACRWIGASGVVGWRAVRDRRLRAATGLPERPDECHGHSARTTPPPRGARSKRGRGLAAPALGLVSPWSAPARSWPP